MHLCVTSIQAALATSVDLRSFLLMLPRSDGSVLLEFPDIQLQKQWGVQELWSQCLGESGEIRMEKVRQFAGTDSNDVMPSVQSLAMQAFLYLLLHIYKDKLRCTMHCSRACYIKCGVVISLYILFVCTGIFQDCMRPLFPTFLQVQVWGRQLLTLSASLLV